jgi:hypothetical protein
MSTACNFLTCKSASTALGIWTNGLNMDETWRDADSVRLGRHTQESSLLSYGQFGAVARNRKSFFTHTGHPGQ